MLDTVNTERYTILAQKWFKITANPMSAYGGPITVGEGNNTGWGVTVMSRATKIVKMWIPGSKFVRSGVLKYENNGSQPKFFDYRCVLYAYSNYSTLQDVWAVGRVNDYIQQTFYKDG